MAVVNSDKKGAEGVFNDVLQEALASVKLTLPDASCQAMFAHFERMCQANRRFNLTRITSPNDAALKHYADSLALLATPWFSGDRSLAVLDVGTGAGFPAVPLAIACDHWRLTAIDGTGKKASFVSEVIDALGLSNLTAEHARAADLCQRDADRFDLVVLRAVGQLAAGIRAVHPLVAPNGVVVFYKGGRMSDEELASGDRVAGQTGLVRTGIVELSLHAGDARIDRRFVRYTRCRG